MKEVKHVDVIITGGSYAGLAAGMALGRAMRKVLIIDSGKPCNAQTPYSHNFLTQDGAPPGQISMLARHQVEQYDSVEFLSDIVVAGMRIDNGFVVETAGGRRFTARKLVFASGIRDMLPDIEGLSECWGISVLHCPYCHGYEVRDTKTGIVGNDDAAFDFVKLLRNWTTSLTLYTNGPSVLQEAQQQLLEKNNIRTDERKIKKIIHQEGQLESLVFTDNTSADLRTMYFRPPFEQHCSVPAQLGCEFTPEGYIQTDLLQRTTLNGVYACGDNTSRMRTVATAVAAGTTAGIAVNKELAEEDFAERR